VPIDLPAEWVPYIVEARLERSYISDLQPLAALTELRRLVLTRSRISDIAPLAALRRPLQPRPVAVEVASP